MKGLGLLIGSHARVAQDSPRVGRGPWRSCLFLLSGPPGADPGGCWGGAGYRGALSLQPTDPRRPAGLPPPFAAAAQTGAVAADLCFRAITVSSPGPPCAQAACLGDKVPLLEPRGWRASGIHVDSGGGLPLV